jgi:hypothetical protein
MVLLSSENSFNINKNHILKCLEKKRNTFKIFVEPLKETYVIEKAPDMNIQFDNLTDKDIETILAPNKKK